MQLQQIDVTGSRIVGPITALGHVGPKHHGIILGKNLEDGHVYVAENMHTGYQIATYHDFCKRYMPNGEIKIAANDGAYSDLTVANRAIEEIKRGGKGIYNLVANNCESFANRAIHDKSISKQVVHTAIGIVVVVGAYWVIKNARK
ncbi:hypothetical protein IOQ59_05800 [Pontibacterium sp. N1Y112]|uniref:LRAT domain-containing protein n=1 Tax=Pontibacterium sinense TaxID=2781979 RepID=A0A8J7F7Y2_9GAMM|nr:hypothetical protein [Pontibacterium sinense]MBE9396775.1 hypothetical protein [Pontibacterium sinense]